MKYAQTLSKVKK